MIIDERKKIGGIDHIQVNILCYGLIGRFLRWCGLLRIEYDLYMLGSPEYVGKLPPHVDVECDCDHEPAPERVVFDGSGGPHMELGWFVVHQSCKKCRQELGRWLQRDVVLGDGQSLRECVANQRKWKRLVL
jgi:hypothetical protein